MNERLRRAIPIVAVAAFVLVPELAAVDVRLVRTADELDMPVSVFAPVDGTGRIYVVEQRGRVRLIERGSLRAEPVLDVSDRVTCCGEQGLLDFTLDPQFASNGHAYVNYTDEGGSTVVARYSLIPGSEESFDPTSERVLLTVAQPFRNHNGGQTRFGPDGALYIAIGDGGSGGDPGNRAQNPGTLLGKILRIRPSADGYTIPADNPFVGTPGARAEIWAFGLRNPWRFSFDRRTGDLWIADVGQGEIEEIDFQPAFSGGGENYGWRLMEGSQCFNPSSGCSRPDLVLPVLEYGHDEGCSVTGGYVYRGRSIRDLEGRYVFGDFCSGTIWVATRQGDGSWEKELLLQTTLNIASFGERADGEILVLDRNGALYRIEREGGRRRGVRR